MTKSVNSCSQLFFGRGKSFGVCIDFIDNIQLFRSIESTTNFMRFLHACGIKFLRFRSIFSHTNGCQDSLFAIDKSALTAIALRQNFPVETAENEILCHFHKHNNLRARAEFSNFCNVNDFWLEGYALYHAIMTQTAIDDFSSWPEILRRCHRKTANVVKQQLSDEVLQHKILQFFAHKQFLSIKEIANAHGIFLCIDCDILCHHLSSDVWQHQQLFFVDPLAQPTVFIGLPESAIYKSGLKTTKVPYRSKFLKTSKYEIFSRMFSRCEELFDAIFLVNAHAIFQYWEVARCEQDPRHGRWVCVPTGDFFKCLDAHFNSFPYLFDFNEPLFPDSEVIVKRHNLLPIVIAGEPTEHQCDVYDLRRKLFAICSDRCNRKVPTSAVHKQNTDAIKLLIGQFFASDYPMCLLDFCEVRQLSGCTSGDFTDMHSEKFLTSILATGNRRTRTGNNKQTQRGNRVATNTKITTQSKFVKFLTNLFQ